MATVKLLGDPATSQSAMQPIIITGKGSGKGNVDKPVQVDADGWEVATTAAAVTWTAGGSGWSAAAKTYSGNPRSEPWAWPAAGWQPVPANRANQKSEEPKVEAAGTPAAPPARAVSLVPAAPRQCPPPPPMLARH